ncbi:hypothetical protein C8Q75DRAFT_151075 [Abortiporus biennis]|nr:hypothetical protein C8Q75DRAFT_151075 [Abortiporus biennis]
MISPRLISIGFALTSPMLQFLGTHATAISSFVYKRDPIGLHNIHTGEVTTFIPGLEACGGRNTSPDFVVAVNSAVFEQFRDVICDNKAMGVTAFGMTLVLRIADECLTCGPDDIALSPGAFEFFLPVSAGEFEAQWLIE